MKRFGSSVASFGRHNRWAKTALPITADAANSPLRIRIMCCTVMARPMSKAQSSQLRPICIPILTQPGLALQNAHLTKSQQKKR